MKKLVWIQLKERKRGQKSTKFNFSFGPFCLVFEKLAPSLLFFELLSSIFCFECIFPH